MKGGTHLPEEQIKRKRGRPPKTQTLETNSTQISQSTNATTPSKT